MLLSHVTTSTAPLLTCHITVKFHIHLGSINLKEDVLEKHKYLNRQVNNTTDSKIFEKYKLI